jgi:multiple sugar transport system permease protein/raffinose/stachyose/melibiose transport system permease protein
MTLDRHLRKDWLPYLYLAFVGAMTFLPFVLLIIISFKTREQFLVNAIMPAWPPRLANYSVAAGVLWRPILNTTIVCVVAIAGTLSVSALAAYAFARFRFPGDTVLFYAILALLMIPGILMLVPRYVIVAQLGMTNTYWALIVPYIASGQIFGIFVLRTFFASIPQELVDSGRVDGAGDFGIFWHIVLPLSKPILGTLAILQMLNIKNDFIWPLVTVTSPLLRTLTLQLRLMEGEMGTEWGLIMAGYTLACVPILIVFAVATRPFIQGMTSGAIKV